MIDADLLGGCVDTLPGYAAAVRLLNCPLYSQVDSAPTRAMKLCVCPTCKVISGGSIIIEIVACPWPADALMSNAANSKQRDKRGWNRAVLMGTSQGNSLPKSAPPKVTARVEPLDAALGQGNSANVSGSSASSLGFGGPGHGFGFFKDADSPTAPQS